MARRRTTRHRPAYRLPPVPLRPPRELSLTGVAAREWRRVALMMRAAGVGTALDVAVLAAYCCAFARFLEAEWAIRDAGLLRTDKDGDERRHPLVMVARAAGQDVARLASELGLSPAARLRVSYDSAGQHDPWEAVLAEVDGGRD